MSLFAVSRSVSRLLAVFVVLSVVLNTGVAYAGSTVTTTVLSATPSVLGQTVTLTATVTPRPPGYVFFSDNGVPIGSQVLDGAGNASFSTAALRGGTHMLTADYLGDIAYAASTSTLTYNVGARPTSLATGSPSPSPVGVGTPSTIASTLTDTALTGPFRTPGSFSPSPTYLSAGRSGHAATLLLDRMLLITGGRSSVGGALLTSVEICLENGFFMPLGRSLNTARAGHTSTLLRDGRVLITGGTTAGGAELASAELYDPIAVTFTALSGAGHALTVPRSGHTATVLGDGTVLITGGTSGGTALSTVEVYNPGSQTFAVVAHGRLAVARSGHAATLLAGGQNILITGGDVAGNTAEVITYTSGTDTVTPSAVATWPTARSGHTATLLPDGNVLIAGGLHLGSAVSTLELYQVPFSLNPFPPTFSTVAPTLGLDTARAGHTATLMNDGLVWFAGGFDASPIPATLNTAVAYTPSYDPTGQVSITSNDGSDTLVNCTLFLSGTGTTTCPVTVAPTAVHGGTRALQVSYSGEINHIAATGSSSLGVQKGTPIVTATGGTFTYNGQPQAGSGSAAGAGGTNLAPVTLSYIGTGGTTYGPTSSAPTNAGAYTVTASFAGNTDYNPGNSTPTAFTITQAPLTITAISFLKTYGMTYGFVGAEFTSSGLVNGDTVTSVTLTSAGAPAAATVAPPGPTFAITVSAARGTGLDNYTITYSPGVMTLAKAYQALLTVSGPIGVTYGSTGTATTTGGSGTGAVTFSAAGSTGCSVSGTTVSVGNASGTCTLTAIQAGDNNYNPGTASAAYPVILLKANQAALTISGPASVTYGSTGTATATGGAGTGTVTSLRGDQPVVRLQERRSQLVMPAALAFCRRPRHPTIITARQPARHTR